MGDHHAVDSSTHTSAGAVAAARSACVCHFESDPDFIAMDAPGWESCVEYWGVECSEDWCRGCRESVVLAALAPEEAKFLEVLPWKGDGPTVSEVGADMLLAFLPFRGEIIPVPSFWDKVSQAWRTHDGTLMASWLPEAPAGWRRMPKVRG